MKRPNPRQSVSDQAGRKKDLGDGVVQLTGQALSFGSRGCLLKMFLRPLPVGNVGQHAPHPYSFIPFYDRLAGGAHPAHIARFGHHPILIGAACIAGIEFLKVVSDGF